MAQTGTDKSILMHQLAFEKNSKVYTHSFLKHLQGFVVMLSGMQNSFVFNLQFNFYEQLYLLLTLFQAIARSQSGLCTHGYFLFIVYHQQKHLLTNVFSDKYCLKASE